MTWDMRPVVFVLSVFFSSSGALGEADPTWVGRKVVTKEATPLQVDDVIVDDGKDFRVYRVEEENSGRLRLYAPGVNGWVKTTDVVPYEDAVAYFTKRIKDNPADDSALLRRGLVLRERGEFDLALADFSACLQLRPDEPLAFDRAVLTQLDLE